MLVYDCDLKLGLHAKRVFDAVGHYSRDDVLPVFVPPAPAEPADKRAAGTPARDAPGRDQVRLA